MPRYARLECDFCEVKENFEFHPNIQQAFRGWVNICGHGTKPEDAHGCRFNDDWWSCPQCASTFMPELKSQLSQA